MASNNISPSVRCYENIKKTKCDFRDIITGIKNAIDLGKPNDITEGLRTIEDFQSQLNSLKILTDELLNCIACPDIPVKKTEAPYDAAHLKPVQETENPTESELAFGESESALRDKRGRVATAKNAKNVDSGISSMASSTTSSMMSSKHDSFAISYIDKPGEDYSHTKESMFSLNLNDTVPGSKNEEGEDEEKEEKHSN